MTTIYGGRSPYKHSVMLDRIKQWCKLNPGKKALLAMLTGSQVLTYDAGSKVFIYSPVKTGPLWNIDAVQELDKDWKNDILNTDNETKFKNQYMGDWDLTKESRLT